MSALQASVERALTLTGGAGASLAITGSGGVATAVAGFADVAAQRRVTPNTRFQIGSTTKPMTALMALRIAEGRGADPHAPLGDWFTAKSEALSRIVSKGITLAQLINHTSGLSGDVFVETKDGADDGLWLLEHAQALDDLHAPGAACSYCNLAYVALGALIEEAYGAPWRLALVREISEPLGLTSLDAIPGGRSDDAVGHLGAGRELKPSPLQALARTNAAAGTTPRATAEDLARFGYAHLQMMRQDGLLTSASAQQMADGAVSLPPGQSCEGFGLGFMTFDWKGGPVYGHDGLTIGQRAFLRLFPEAGLSVALLANGGDMKRLSHLIFDDLRDFTGAQPTSLIAGDGPPPPRAALGAYHRQNASATLEDRHGFVSLTVTNHEAWAIDTYGATEGPFPLQPVTKGVWGVARGGEMLDGLSFYPDGSLCLGHRLYRKGS